MIIRLGPKSEVVNVEENSHQYIMSYILDVLIPGGLSYGITEIPNMNHIRLDFRTLPKCSDKIFSQAKAIKHDVVILKDLEIDLL